MEQAGQGHGEVRDLAPETAVLDGMLEPRDEGRRPRLRRLGRRRRTASAPRRPGPPPSPSPDSRGAAGAGGAADASPYAAGRSNMVRVDFAQLDHLLNLVGELIIHRTKLQQVGKEMAEQVGGGAAGRELQAAVQQIATVSASLQETVMDVRMLPIRHVFERFPRLVRDLARQTGKDIELILEGENTRIDKAIIDEIGEPLVHLIRNSVDHGIETPEERIALGKTPTGTILLSAAQESNHVVITIMDDGSGIDAARVQAKAVARGLLKGDEALSERDVVQLIFAQGFSTREAITEVSGRGVGLDVVLKSIERLNGLVEVGDGARRRHQVHHPAAPDPRHHLRAAGGGRGAKLRRAAGLGGGEHQVRAGPGPDHQRTRGPAHPRPHRAGGAAGHAVRPRRRPGRRSASTRW